MHTAARRTTLFSIVCSAAAIFGAGSLFAQPVQWDGGNVTTVGTGALGSAQWNTAANWSGDAVPASGADILIANGPFATLTGDHMAVAGAAQAVNLTYGSIAFDNAAGQFPVGGLRVIAMQANTFNASIRYVYLNGSSGTILSAINNANVQMYGNVTNGTTANAFRLLLNYDGMANVHVDSTSSLTLGNSTRFEAAPGFNGGITKTGGGVLSLSGVGNFTGGLNLTEGTLLIASSSNNTIDHANFGRGPVGLGTLTLSGGTIASTGNNVTGNRILDNPVAFNGSVTIGNEINNGVITFTNNANHGPSSVEGQSVINAVSNVLMNVSLGGGGSLAKTGAGTLTLSQVATYTGGTILQGGMLQLQDSDKLPAGGAVTFDGGTLRVSAGGANVTAWSADHATTITSNSGTFNLASGINLTWSGNVSGVGALRMNVNSLGTLTLTGTNTYTGGTEIDAGTVKGSIGSGNLAVAAGATYDLYGADRSVAALSGAGQVNLGSHTLSTGGNTNSTFDGVIAGAGGLTKTGTGSLTLSGVNTYGGTTTVSAGTLSGSIGSGNLTVSSGAAYQLGGADRSVGTLSGAGHIALGSNRITTDSSANSAYSGNLTGTGGLTKSGAGTLTLSGNNTYSGTTQVTAGGLQVLGTLSGNVTIDSGASLSGNGTLSGTTTVGGIHNPGSSPGVQTFGNLTYLSGAIVNWELTANDSQLLNPTVHDHVVVFGTLNFAGATLLNLSFDGPGSTVVWSDAFWTTDQEWLLYDATDVSGVGDLAVANFNWQDSQGAYFDVVLAGGNFSVSQAANGVILHYTAAVIPEPATTAVLLGLAGLAFAAYRRRLGIASRSQT